MPVSAAPRHNRIDKVFNRLLDEVPATLLDALAPPSQLSWRDFNGDEALETLARAELAKIRGSQVANISLVRTWRVYRFVLRAVPAGTSYEDADKLVPQAEASVDRVFARLSRRYPMLAAEPPLSPSATAIYDMTERANAAWQAGAGGLYSQSLRTGEMEIIEPAGLRLVFDPDRNPPAEWYVRTEVSKPKDAHKLGAVWDRLYLTHEDTDALVAEVKRSLGLSVPETSPPPEPQDGGPQPPQLQDADGVEPELRALADRLFEHWRQLPNRRITREKWQELARAEEWATHKRTIVDACRLVFKTKKKAPPIAGWPLQDHYARKLQALTKCRKCF